MNRLSRLIASSIAMLLAAGMTLNYSACSNESPMSPTVDSDQQADFQILAKKGGKGKGKFEQSSTTLESSSTSTDVEVSSSTSTDVAESSSTNTDVEESSSTSLEDNSIVGSTIIEGSKVVRYLKRQGIYKWGLINIASGSQFQWAEGSLTPPPELAGKDVTLTMKITTNGNNESVFEFGPSGCKFEPAATIWFHYAGSNPTLYYINDDGTYVEQQPDEVDPERQWIMLKINHFSRYAVAWAN